MARTPRNTLSSELIVRTALELMESKGTDAFSLRGVAAELGVSPMALYTYFRNKDDLYDAVRDHLMGLLPAVPQDVAWPDQVRAVCRSLRLLMLQHPCLAQLLSGRPLSGHETARVAEGLLGVLRRPGSTRRRRRGRTPPCSPTCSGQRPGRSRWPPSADPDSWRRLRTTMESLSGRDFPTVVELAPELARTTGGDEQFDYGLDLLLAGLRVRTPS